MPVLFFERAYGFSDGVLLEAYWFRNNSTHFLGYCYPLILMKLYMSLHHHRYDLKIGFLLIGKGRPIRQLGNYLPNLSNNRYPHFPDHCFERYRYKLRLFFLVLDLLFVVE